MTKAAPLCDAVVMVVSTDTRHQRDQLPLDDRSIAGNAQASV